VGEILGSLAVLWQAVDTVASRSLWYGIY
jgi:hypothetical protein